MQVKSWISGFISCGCPRSAYNPSQKKKDLPNGKSIVAKAETEGFEFVKNRDNRSFLRLHLATMSLPSGFRNPSVGV